MNLLLDTVAFLWLLEDSKNLSAVVRASLEDEDNIVFLSAASTWEITVKHQLGKLPLPQPPEKLIPQQRRLRGIESLGISEAAVLRLRQLPDFHKDPFDRIIACQAIEHSMTVLTPDELIRVYPVQTLW
ncbi:MAG: type II toxin-antitoxin system VapC family toxin [Candidatus Eremiobacteraeota bacterium]|nr:type II toxin-antitoxin system VapC family toxin [Candidatus Eremiobacteraeota bacterium]MBV8355686.1 type II toxin-antitoxin system VapC family toxin [Candidatus Eremiobacteraeota bacterium]